MAKQTKKKDHPKPTPTAENVREGDREIRALILEKERRDAIEKKKKKCSGREEGRLEFLAHKLSQFSSCSNGKRKSGRDVFLPWRKRVGKGDDV